MQKSYGRLEQNKNKEIVTKNDQPASGAGFERAVLVAVIRDQQDPRQAEEYLAELEFLAETAGIVGVRRFTQRLPQPSARIYVGPGKLEEIAAYCKEEEIDVAIFDDELSPSQTRNIEAAMPCRILDRTRLILDIFMSRAQTAYAKTQVQLANYQYMLPRLSGMWTHLERQRGGTGTRGGAGEREIETDRRIIRNRISKLKEDLQKIDRQMAVQRSNRGSMVRVALVGYTNAGKSTLMNALTAAGVLAEDRLFATLDPTARTLRLPDGREVLLVDTVGLVRRLPHQLVEAFHSTLEEAAQADAILNVCDAASPEAEEQLQLTEDLLRELRAEEADRPEPPTLRVYNKCDLLGGPIALGGRRAVAISAATGAGLTQLLDTLAAVLPPDRRRVQVLIPFREGALAERCRRQGAGEKEQFTPEGVQMTVTLGLRELEAVRPYLMETPPENGAPSA